MSGYIKVPLKTRAKCRARHADPHTNAVSLQFPEDGSGAVFVIETTPGRWCLSTLLGFDPYGGPAGNIIPIDSGQGWECTNLRELLTEALGLVFGEHSPTVAQVIASKGDQ